ncbi:MAG: RNA-binding protein [archaeon]|nr:RNA-binding protein [archaeon]
MTENTVEEHKTSKSERKIVIPGEILSEDPKMIPGRGAIRVGNKITAIFIGLENIRGRYVNVVPLRGIYNAEIGDKIIGKIADKSPVKWYVNINSLKEGVLKPSDAMERRDRGRGGRGGGQRRPSREDEAEALKNLYKIGDTIICKIISTDRVTSPVLTTLGEGLGKIHDGLCIQIDVPKIPRIIGKKGSMIKLIKDLTTCRLFVSKNGRIWIRGKTDAHEKLAIDVIQKIQREAHTQGLTDRVQYYIQEQKKERGIA